MSSLAAKGLLFVFGMVVVVFSAECSMAEPVSLIVIDDYATAQGEERLCDEVRNWRNRYAKEKNTVEDCGNDYFVDIRLRFLTVALSKTVDGLHSKRK
jgi:hypothetical protein